MVPWNNKCPFCGIKLINSKTYCPGNITLPCLECKTCGVFFYSKIHYNSLKRIAFENKRKLGNHVYYYSELELAKGEVKSKQAKQKTKTKVPKEKLQKQRKAVPKEFKSKQFKNSIVDIPIETVNKINYKRINRLHCAYYQKGYCMYLDDKCNPASIRCYLFPHSDKAILNKKEMAKENNRTENRIKHTSSEKTILSVIILTDNRKCLNKNHLIIDVITVCKIVTSIGTVKDVETLAGYCSICDEYFMLKSDFLRIKQEGVLLCQVIDKTPQHLAKHKNSFYGNESCIHSLGYNVIKQYNYTNEQRRIILANILENTNISRHEILSIIDANIARHRNQSNYAEAIRKWTVDREYVMNYKLGDCPEVIVRQIQITKR